MPIDVGQSAVAPGTPPASRIKLYSLTTDDKLYFKDDAGNVREVIDNRGSQTITGNLSVTTLTASSLTSGRVVIAGTAGLLEDDAGFTYDKTTDVLSVGTSILVPLLDRATIGTLSIGGTATAISSLISSTEKLKLTSALLDLGTLPLTFGSAIGSGSVALSYVSSGVLGVGTGAAGSVAGTLRATRYDVNGTASLAIEGGSTTQMYLTTGGSRLFAFGSNIGPAGGSLWGANTALGWSSNSDPAAAGGDLFVHRDAADTLAQRRGTNAQAMRIYGLYNSAADYQRLRMAFISSNFFIGTESATSGAIGLRLHSGSTTLSLFTQGTATEGWQINTGNLVALTDNTYDIGASGATRPRNVFIAGTITTGGVATIGGTLTVNGGSSINSNGDISVLAGRSLGFGSHGGLQSGGSDGIMQFRNNGNTDFIRVQLGGTSASFPAIARSTTDIHIKLADDSAFTGLKAKTLTVSDGTFALISSAAFNNGVGVAAGTLLTAPTAGDPTKWIPINDNGTTRYVPAW